MTTSAPQRFPLLNTTKKKELNVLGAQFVVVVLIVILLRPSFAVTRRSELDMPRLNMVMVFACGTVSVAATLVLLRMRFV